MISKSSRTTGEQSGKRPAGPIREEPGTVGLLLGNDRPHEWIYAGDPVPVNR